ncbi:MAG: NACHT domain-containing protein, partial [Bacteroidota bacterium]
MSVHRKLRLSNQSFNLQIDSKKVGANLFDAVVHLADFKLGSFAQNLALETVKNVDAASNIAFDLIFNSLKQASIHAIDDFDPKFQDKRKNLATEKAGFNYDLTQQLNELFITKRIFKKPERWEFLKSFQLFFEEWLQAVFDFTLSQAQSISRNIRFYFAEALYAEWDEHPNRYSVIKDFFENNPFTEQLDRLRQKYRYYARIKLNYQQPALGDPNMSLADIYVEPYFKVHKRNLPKTDAYKNEDKDGFFQLTSEQSLHEYVNALLLQNQAAFDLKAEQSRMLLLLGQPGQGKSSFCHRLVHDLLEDANMQYEKDLIFVRLRDLPDAREFVKHPFDRLQKDLDIPAHLDLNNAIIILDGLDELYMTEGLSNEEINDFFNRIIKLTENKTKSKVIVTSRYHYVRLDNFTGRDCLILSLAPMTYEQQLQWLSVYRRQHTTCKLTEALLQKVHHEKGNSFEDIKQLINQPILLHLVAKANFDITEGRNKADIYSRLFDRLISRDWEKDKRKFKQEEEEYKADFRAFIRELAHHIYQSDQEYILLPKLREEKFTQDFIKYNFKRDEDQIEEALRDVLISFYFKPVERNQTKEKEANAIEFYHKSLQEFLAVEHIWQTIRKKFLEKDGRKYRLDDAMEALAIVWKLSTPKGITQDMLPYLIDLIQNDEDLAKRQALADRMSSFLTELLEVHFLYEYKADPKNPEPMKQAMGCFYVYWSVLSHLVEQPKEEFFLYLNEDNKENFFHCMLLSKRFEYEAFFNLKSAS